MRRCLSLVRCGMQTMLEVIVYQEKRRLDVVVWYKYPRGRHSCAGVALVVEGHLGFQRFQATRQMSLHGGFILHSHVLTTWPLC